MEVFCFFTAHFIILPSNGGLALQLMVNDVVPISLVLFKNLGHERALCNTRLARAPSAWLRMHFYVHNIIIMLQAGNAFYYACANQHRGVSCAYIHEKYACAYTRKMADYTHGRTTEGVLDLGNGAVSEKTPQVF